VSISSARYALSILETKIGPGAFRERGFVGGNQVICGVVQRGDDVAIAMAQQNAIMGRKSF
jgi:hypothetical protein